MALGDGAGRVRQIMGAAWSRSQTTISNGRLGRLCHRQPVLSAGTLLHPRVPSLKTPALRWHRQLHEPRKDQTPDDRDVGHREDLTRDERLAFQNAIEVVHTP